MQMNEKVLTALEVLKDCAENDFERHRIDVLIKDLTDPPKVEIIDDKHQKFNGVIYRRDESGHFRNKGVSVHRTIYQYYYGEIPEGYEIHHQDCNPDNNDIHNLIALTKIQHRKSHVKAQIPRSKEKFICKNCGKEFESLVCGRNLFCSRECKERYNYKQSMCVKKCKYCGKEFVSSRFNETDFCSHHCVNKFRYIGNHKEKICPICGKTFETTKTNAEQIYCSQKCGRVARRQKATVEKICPICGNKFKSLKHENKICCSRSCAGKLSHQAKSLNQQTT